MTPPMLRATTTESRQHVDAAALAAHMTLDEHGQWQHRSLYCGSGSRPLSLAIDSDAVVCPSRAPSSQGHYPSSPASATSHTHTRIEDFAPAFTAHVSRSNSFVAPPSPRVLKSALLDCSNEAERQAQPLSREALSSSGDSSASSEHSVNSSATHSLASSSNTLPTPDSPSSNDGDAVASSGLHTASHASTLRLHAHWLRSTLNPASCPTRQALLGVHVRGASKLCVSLSILRQSTGRSCKCKSTRARLFLLHPSISSTSWPTAAADSIPGRFPHLHRR